MRFTQLPRLPRFIAGLLLLALAGRGAFAADDEGAESRRIDQLIAELGDAAFNRRERAQAELTRLGVVAFDALSAAAESPENLEVSLRAHALLQTIEINWIHDDDPQDVSDLLKGYAALSDRDRRNRMQGLARLPEQRGVSALCRLVRYEGSSRRARYAAVAVLEQQPSDEHWAIRPGLIKEALGQCRRTPAEWLRVHVRLHGDPRAEAAAWSRLTDAEFARFRGSSPRTSDAIVRPLLLHQIRLYRHLKRAEAATLAMTRLLDLESGEAPQLVELMDWLLAQRAWPVIDKAAARFSDQFDETPLLIYQLAKARADQGEIDASEHLAARARKSGLGEKEQHLTIASELRERGMRDWSDGELRLVAEMEPVDHRYTIQGLIRWGESLHDRGHNTKAADSVEKGIARIEQFAVQSGGAQLLTAPLQYARARMHYYRACAYGRESQYVKQREHLDKALEHYPSDVDAIIGLYRLPDQTDEQKEAVREQIRALTDQLRQRIRQTARYYSAYNHFAWLVSNTEGDQAEALRMSLRSLELKPDESSLLDTLGRCYYANGDLDNALKYQLKAVERDPTSGLLRGQLEFFKAEQAKRSEEK